MVSVRRAPTNEFVETYNKAGGADYDSLSVWEALRDVDLVAIATSYSIKFVGLGSHNDSVAMAGWTTNTTYWPRIFVDPSVKHTGVPGTGATLSSTTLRAIESSTQNAQFQDLIISHVANSASAAASIYLAVSGCAVIGCIFDDCRNDGASVVDAIRSQFSTGTSVVADSIIIGPNTYSGIIAVSAHTMLAFNNLVLGCQEGYVRSSSTFISTNNIAQGCTTGYVGTQTKTTCIDSGVTGNIQATLTFVDAPNDNYRLAASDTVAIGAGTDLSADATYPFDDDIVGETRTAPWDIGAFKYIAAGNTRRNLALTGVGR